jgi:hypothetical protein
MQSTGEANPDGDIAFDRESFAESAIINLI